MPKHSTVTLVITCSKRYCATVTEMVANHWHSSPSQCFADNTSLSRCTLKGLPKQPWKPKDLPTQRQFTCKHTGRFESISHTPTTEVVTAGNTFPMHCQWGLIRNGTTWTPTLSLHTRVSTGWLLQYYYLTRQPRRYACTPSTLRNTELRTRTSRVRINNGDKRCS